MIVASVLTTLPSTAVTASDDPTTLDVDESGTYQITELTAGTYLVRQVVPTGYAQTFPADRVYQYP